MVSSTSSRAELEAEVGDASWRVLALWGAPGVGKSFLSFQAFPCESAERWLRVPLGAADSAEGATRALLRVLRPEAPEGAAERAGFASLLNAQAPVGLVLDDVDAVLPWLEVVLPGWLERVPDLRVVLTLRVRPDQLLGAANDARALEVVPLPGEAAQELFARLALRAGAPIPEAQRAFVGQLCHELGGLPLALELAAARLDVLSVPALLHRVRSQGVPMPENQRSLEAVLISSWQGLDASLQTLLMLLAWPPSGVSLEQLEVVLEALAGAGGAPQPGAALELVSALRRRAWLLRDAERLVLSPPLRRFVEARTPVDLAWRIELAWAEYYAGAESVVPAENLHRVLERAVTTPQLSTRFADAALGVISRGFAQSLELGTELGQALERVLAKVIERSHQSGASLPLICEAMALQAKALLARGDARGAAQLGLRALDFARRAARDDLELLALLTLSRALGESGQLRDARSSLERARDLVGPGTDAWRCLELADAYRALQDLDAARVQAERCLARIPEDSVGFGACRGAAELLLGDVCVELGDEAGVARHLAEADRWIRVAMNASDAARPLAQGLELRLEYLRAREALHARRLSSAEAGFVAAVHGFREIGAGRAEALARYHLGVTRRERGQAGAAFVELELALQGLPRGGREWAFCALHLAQLEREARAESRALSWFGQVREQASRVGLTELAELASALARGGSSPFAAERSLRELDLRLLERCASRRQMQSLRAEPDSWLVARDGSWFRPPGGEQVPLGRRKALGAILAALAEARANGLGCSRAQLIEAGWPGERILEAAATQRLRVALSTLRKLGLESLIRTLEDGYALGSDVPVARV
ncbi:MAG: hypothetical protein KC766_10190 [Myxococcales bacterium]|nr:hypothetical protein [Myxococcales bacterium]